MITISPEPISPEAVINRVRTPASGGVVTYVGLIRDNSRGKPVATVEYRDADGKAQERLEAIAAAVKSQWDVSEVAIQHRVAKLAVGDINVVVAVSAPHRVAAFEACSYVIDQFKEQLPTHKVETYSDGTTFVPTFP
jgi:molybdopterin synthase catalytic subunit